MSKRPGGPLFEESRFVGAAVEQFERAWASCWHGARHRRGKRTDDTPAHPHRAPRGSVGRRGGGAGEHLRGLGRGVVLAGAVPRASPTYADAADHPETLSGCHRPDTRCHRRSPVPAHGRYGCTSPDRRAAGIVLSRTPPRLHTGDLAGPAPRLHRTCRRFYRRDPGAFGTPARPLRQTHSWLTGCGACRHGRANGSWYRHDMVGTDSRLDAMQAVVLTASSQAGRLDRSTPSCGGAYA